MYLLSSISFNSTVVAAGIACELYIDTCTEVLVIITMPKYLVLGEFYNFSLKTLIY